MSEFSFHLSERTQRAILHDPQLPDSPTFGDIRAALLRLDAAEAAEKVAQTTETRDKKKVSHEAEKAAGLRSTGGVLYSEIGLAPLPK
jgi:hypothetical protein